MDKREFIDKFASSESTLQRNRKAEKMSLGALKFDCRKNISFEENGKRCAIDFCEICFHSKGVTMNFFELCPSFEGVDIRELAKDLKRRCESYFKLAHVEGQCMSHIVIPPEPEMIMELGKHVDEIMKLGDFCITVYDPKKDKRGACIVSEDFLESLKTDSAFKGKDCNEVFTIYLTEFAEAL